MAIDQGRWQDRLTELAGKHGVPAASLAVYSRGETTLAATGVLNVETGVEADPRSVFQIGSLTKAYTAFMVMRLVDQGAVDLDVPLVQYVPEFRVADADASATVTLRHLLAHTSGIDGDHFADTGRDDDALERYVDSCATLEQVVPVGATFSYCNAGYAIIGRVIEKLTGLTWDAALQELVVQPLGLTRTVTLAENAVRFRVAYGHVPGPDGTTLMAPYWAMPRSMGPAGGIVATAEDVLAFGRVFLDQGAAPSGTRLLDEATVAAIQTPQVEVADVSLADFWSLGVVVQDWDGVRLYGHDGGTVGQGAFLRWVPDRDFAVALLANSTGGLAALRDDLYRELFAECCGVETPTALQPLGQPAPSDADHWLGIYERINFRVAVERRDGTLHGTVTIGGLAAQALGGATFSGPLEWAGDNLYVTRLLGSATGDWMTVAFFRLEDGSRYVHIGGRAQRQVAATS